MTQNNFGKRILALLFLAIMAIGCICSGAYTAVGNIYNYLAGKPAVNEAEESEDGTTVEAEMLTMSSINETFVDSMLPKQELINLNGAMAKNLNIQGYYSSMGMYVTDEKYIVSVSAQTSTDYEYDQTVAFKKYLDEKGINLIYINQPTKYVDDNLFSQEFGVESYSNRNADLFLERIAEAGIPVIDLRDDMEEEGINVYDMFYRTDHHWTTRSGLWAARKIAEGLNEYCGYSIDTSIYDETNYTFTEWENCWLGEQGRKIGKSYVGLDDFTEIKPKFETSFTFKKKEELTQGTFDDFVREDYYNTEQDVYDAKSWHYSYTRQDAINNNVDYGKVLFLGDSYAQVVLPFLSLGVSELDSLILRSYKGDLRELIEKEDYDTVVIGYAQFMIGAHDNPKSANYAMFTFE